MSRRFCALAVLLAVAGPALRAGEHGSDHWAFRPVRDHAVPRVRDAGWAQSPVDCFILAALEEKGLRPGPAADRRTLIRRLSFDVLGLPPLPEDVEAFVRDRAPDAYEKLVDRLLSSPHYGERWGRHWLDVVRYADTAGETADYPVPDAYRYRNYVLDAFNQDRPYDQFLREQLAGDILARDGAAGGTVTPARYAELVTATGFLAISRRFGYDTERYEHLTIADTIDVLGQAVQGLTLGCARCHDHKYDPITLADYYGLYGIFASTRYAFAGSEELQALRVLTPLVPPAEAKRRWGGLPPPPNWHWLTELDGDLETQATPKGGSLGRPASPWLWTGETAIDAGAQSPFTNVYPRGSNGALLPAGKSEHSLRRGLVPAVTAGQLSFNLDLRIAGDPKGTSGSYRVYLGRGPGSSPAVELFAGPDTLFVRNGFAVERVCPLTPGTWYNVQLTLDLDARSFSGTVGKAGQRTPLAARKFAPTWGGRIDTFLLDTHGHLPGARPGLHADNFALSPQQSGAAKPPNGGPTIFQGADAPRWGAAYAVWDGTPHDVRIQKRGEPDRPGKLVRRGFPEVLGGQRLPADADGSGRRELANWLTAPANPLTARVMVNRIWQHHFGKGLVATPNDFGTRGGRPSHPELLDWLASRFIAAGWSVKAMHRLILLSATYRLASSGHAQATGVDPDNRLLARFGRRRLEAECIRDALLELGGNLERGAAGPHPFPPLDRQKYTQHQPFLAVYETNRRSVYLMTQRLRRHPFLALFDGPDPNASTAVRTATTVPTQALFLMNDPFVHRQSDGLAARLLAQAGDDAGRVDQAYRRAFARPPGPDEVAEALDFLARYQAALAGTGVPEGQRPAQAWAAFARSLFARNEFVFVD